MIKRGELYYAEYIPITFNTEAEFNADKRDKYYVKDGKYTLTEMFVTGTVDYFVIIPNEALDANGDYKINSNTYTVIKNLITDTNFKSVENANNSANLSGIVYIDNRDGSPVDEAEISGTMQAAYPNMKFFVTNAIQAYSAKFVVMNDDGSYKYVPDINGDSTYDSIQKVSKAEFSAGRNTFNNPFNLYDASQSKDHYDFIGWCKDEVPAADRSNILLINESDKRGSTYKGFDWGVINEEDYSQIYYAAFEGHYYEATFKDKANPSYKEVVRAQYDPDGKNKFHANVKEPSPVLETADEYRYALRGWTTTENYGGYYDTGMNIDDYLVDISTIPVIGNITLYAVFQLESVYDKPTDYKYFNFTAINDNIKGVGWQISLKEEYATMLTGKITLPAKYTKDGIEKDVVSIGKFQYNIDTPLNITHIFFMPGSKYVSVDNYCYRATLNCNPKLEMIKFPEDMTTLKYIGGESFYECYELKDIYYNGTVEDWIKRYGKNYI